MTNKTSFPPETVMRKLSRKLGIESKYRAIPTDIREEMVRNICPPPLVKLDASASADPDARVIQRGIEQALASENLEMPALGLYLSITEFMTTFRSLRNWSRYYSKRKPRDANLLAVSERCETVMAAVLAGPLGRLGPCVDEALLPFTRFDERLFGHTISDGRINNAQMQTCIHVNKVQPRDIRVMKPDGGLVKAWQVAAPMGNIEWLEWSPGQIGIQAKSGLYPVFAESHALRQFAERMPLKIEGHWEHDYLFHSLKKAQVATRLPDGAFLVPYHPWEMPHCGYFVVHFDGDRFRVVTFLFLTMTGTPESDRLYKKLRLKRHGKEITGLDRMETFLSTDLRNDKELVKILSECGCGHLFKLAVLAKIPIQRTGRAMSIRRYWGMPLHGFDS